MGDWVYRTAGPVDTVRSGCEGRYSVAMKGERRVRTEHVEASSYEGSEDGQVPCCNEQRFTNSRARYKKLRHVELGRDARRYTYMATSFQLSHVIAVSA